MSDGGELDDLGADELSRGHAGVDVGADPVSCLRMTSTSAHGRARVGGGGGEQDAARVKCAVTGLPDLVFCRGWPAGTPCVAVPDGRAALIAIVTGTTP